MSRVLLVGDAGNRRESALRAFADTSTHVTVTDDTADALRLAQGTVPDAIALIDSPACEALAFTQRVRAEHALHSCMLVVVALRDRHTALLAAGADQALGAGATAEELLQAVDGRIARRRQLLEVGSADARRRTAEQMVERMATAGRLQAVMALRVDRLDALAAAVGADNALLLRSELRTRLAPLLPKGCAIIMLDEGAVVALDAHAAAADVAATLMHHARMALHVDGRELRLRVHAGMVAMSGSALDAATAIRRAEVAAREARDQSLNEPHNWNDEMGLRVLGDLEIASAMRRAVEQAEFRLVFQPQVRMDRGEPFGVEAFIRWNMPGGVSVPPNRFVAVAEETGLIDDIGAWSLREACRSATGWDRQGLRLRVSVNVSPRQMLNEHFIDTVRQALSESGLAADRLSLEVGESALLREAKGLHATLESLRTIGVGVCLDDFGAGLATLASLRGLPISEIKIDRSFVRPLPGTPEDRMAVQTVIGLAHQLGLRAIAVGVEHAAQWAWLKEQGCDAAQGWLIGKPVEAEGLVETIAALRRGRGHFVEPAPASDALQQR